MSDQASDVCTCGHLQSVHQGRRCTFPGCGCTFFQASFIEKPVLGESYVLSNPPTRPGPLPTVPPFAVGTPYGNLNSIARSLNPIPEAAFTSTVSKGTGSCAECGATKHLVSCAHCGDKVICFTCADTKHYHPSSRPLRELCLVCAGRGVTGQPITQCPSCGGGGTKERELPYDEIGPPELTLEVCIEACEKHGALVAAWSFKVRDGKSQVESLKFQVEATYTNPTTGSVFKVPIWKSFERIRLPEEEALKIVQRLAECGALGVEIEFRRTK